MSEVAPQPTEDTANRDLVLRFESLGGRGHGCEFGIFQRGQGAEPLGLLRWADLDQTALIAALNDRFAGVGEPEHTEIFVPSNAEEYWTRDRRYWMAMRTFMRTAEIPPERAEGLILNRLRFLRRKLIEDLEAGDKIFVFKNMMRDLYPHELAALHRAVRSYGDAVLLCLRFADAAAPDGSVRAVARGLLVGAVAHFSFSPEDQPLGEPTDSFLAVCREAVRLRNEPGVWNGLPDVLDAPDPDAMQREGLERLHQGDHAGAEAALRAALQTRDSVMVRVALAEALLAQGQSSEAAIVLQEATTIEPDNVTALDRLADTLDKLGDASGFLRVAERVAALTPEVAGRRLRLARAFLANGDAVCAEREIRAIDSSDVDGLGAQPHHILGIALEWQGRVEEAAVAAQLASEAEPKNPMLLGRISELLLRTGEAEKAMEYANSATILDPKNPHWRDLLSRIPASSELNRGLYPSDWPKHSDAPGNKSASGHRADGGVAEAVNEGEEISRRQGAVGEFFDQASKITSLLRIKTKRRNKMKMRSTNQDDFRSDGHSSVEAKAYPGEEDKPRHSGRSKSPISSLRGWFDKVTKLREDGALDELDYLFVDPPRPVAADLGILSIWASVPRIRRDWPEALRRARLLIDRWPHHSKPWLHAIYAIDQVYGYHAVLDKIQELMVRFPDDPNIIGPSADVATQRRDWERAVQLWQHYAKTCEMPVGHVRSYIVALVNAGRQGEAKETLEFAISRFGKEQGLANLQTELELLPRHP